MATQAAAAIWEEEERRARPPATARQLQVGVLVADDHPVVRAGVTAAIRRQADLAVVGEAEEGRDALEKIRSLRPEVAVLDTALPGLDGLAVLGALTSEGLPTRVLLLADVCAGMDVHEAMTSGGSGYLTKGEPLTDICHCIRRVAGGNRCLSPSAQAALLEHLSAAPRPLLTEREVEIVQLMAEGRSSAAIGRRLHLSESTVKNHRRHIYSKLGVGNSAAAIYRAVRVGLVS